MFETPLLVRFTQECLANLHDLGFLAAHPLGRATVPANHRNRGEAVRGMLVAAIERLRPAGSPGGAASIPWRRYQLLGLRYLEGWSLQMAADRLGVSARQASRDHQQAVEVLARLIWSAYLDDRAEPASEPPFPLDEVQGGSVARLGGEETGPAKPHRAGAADPGPGPDADPEGPTELAATVRGVIETMAKLAAERAVHVDVSIADTLSPITLSRTVLRQGLFNVLGYVVAVSPGAHVQLTAAETHRGLDLRIDARRRPGRPRRPSLDAADETLAADAQLTAGRKLLQAHGTAIDLRHQPDGALGIVLALPAANERRVLVVDDNPDIVSVFRRYLRGAGYRLIHASTAAGAVRLAADLRPDVVILDLMMPTQDGWEVLTQLRALPAIEHTPVVVCSVLPEQSLASSLGVAAFLAKPVNRRALLVTLEQLAPASAPAGRLD